MVSARQSRQRAAVRPVAERHGRVAHGGEERRGAGRDQVDHAVGERLLGADARRASHERTRRTSALRP